jgi:hypothetical protein
MARVEGARFGHVFQLPDVAAALEIVGNAGGRCVGEVITTATATGRQVTWWYATDPDGTIVELQAWS